MSADVLIITAAPGEDEAARQVFDGRTRPWERMKSPTGFGFSIWNTEFDSFLNTRALKVVMTRAPQMGADTVANVAGRLVEVFRPQCLAMCGVCAGRPGWTELGDVIIADRVWRYDYGERFGDPVSRPQFYADVLTYQLNAQWREAAEHFCINENSSWLKGRPKPLELQEHWILHQLLVNKDPIESSVRDIECPDWSKAVAQLEERGFVSLRNNLRITAAGKAYIRAILLRHAEKLPQQQPWRLHLGPLGTGANLVRDLTIWDRVQDTQRLVRGLDMEASVIGLTGHLQNVPYAIVVKGVMDFADPARNDDFRSFSARAAAEVLILFLRQRLDPLHDMGIRKLDLFRDKPRAY